MAILNVPRVIFVTFWVTLCITALWWFVDNPEAWIDPEATVLCIFVMLTITFPIGIVYWSILSVLAVAIPDPNLGREVELALIWIGFVVVGYVQWALLVPWGYRKLKEALQTRRLGRLSSK